MIKKMYLKWLRKELISFMDYIKRNRHSVEYSSDIPVDDYIYHYKTIKDNVKRP
jgi:hypothetical protein